MSMKPGVPPSFMSVQRPPWLRLGMFALRRFHQTFTKFHERAVVH